MNLLLKKYLKELGIFFIWLNTAPVLFVFYTLFFFYREADDILFNEVFILKKIFLYVILPFISFIAFRALFVLKNKNFDSFFNIIVIFQFFFLVCYTFIMNDTFFRRFIDSAILTYAFLSLLNLITIVVLDFNHNDFFLYTIFNIAFDLALIVFFAQYFIFEFVYIIFLLLFLLLLLVLLQPEDFFGKFDFLHFVFWFLASFAVFNFYLNQVF